MGEECAYVRLTGAGTCFVHARHPVGRLAGAALAVGVSRLRHRRIAWLSGAMALLLGWPTAAALGQTVSPAQLPPGEAAQAPDAAAKFSFPVVQGLAAPEGADAVRFTLRELKIDNELGDPSVLIADARPVAGQPVSVGDIYRYAAALQRAVLAAGYPLARVVIPPQDLDRDAGVVQLRIISGFLQSVDTSGLPGRVRGIVAGTLAPLVEQRNLRAETLERRLLLAGSTVGLNLRSSLTAGNVVGGAVLVVTGEHKLLQGAVSLDNRLSDDLGKTQLTAFLAVNGVAGLGEQLTVTVAAPTDDVTWSDKTRRYVSGSVQLPVGRNGLVVTSDYVFSSSRPGGAASGIDLRATYRQASLSAAYPLLLRRNARQTVRLGLDAASEVQTTSILGPAVRLSEDRTRVVRLVLEGSYPLPLNMRLDFDTELSRGIAGLGARTAAKATTLLPLSRFGADADFTRVAGRATVALPLLPAASLHLGVRGQSSFGEPLLRSEQGSVLSPDLVSGPPSGSLSADSFIGARVEARAAASVGPVRLAPYLFGVAADSYLSEALATERRKVSITGGGVGVRTGLTRGAALPLSFNLEWSWLDSAVAGLDGSWVSFSAVTRF